MILTIVGLQTLAQPVVAVLSQLLRRVALPDIIVLDMRLVTILEQPTTLNNIHPQVVMDMHTLFCQLETHNGLDIEQFSATTLSGTIIE